jgi:hypothetical protein
MMRLAAVRVLAMCGLVAIVGCGREALESWWRTGRVVDRPGLHVGVRPAYGWPDQYGITLQVSR